MLKKFLALGLFIIGSSAAASEFLIKVTPAEKITTAGDKIQEGDEVQFQVVSSTSPKIKKGEKNFRVYNLLREQRLWRKRSYNQH